MVLPRTPRETLVPGRQDRCRTWSGQALGLRTPVPVISDKDIRTLLADIKPDRTEEAEKFHRLEEGRRPANAFLNARNPNSQPILRTLHVRVRTLSCD